MAETNEEVIPREELQQFVINCMTTVGAQTRHATALAEVVVAADYRGHYSHGLNRLAYYVEEMELKLVTTDKEPEVVNETPGTAFVNGHNVAGPVVGNFCMDLAIKKAKEVGVGWVVATRSNHFGIAGWYGLQAMRQGLIGMAFTNTSPLMVPTRGKENVLGTNPINVAAPAKDGDSFCLDMATTAVALGKVELSDRKGVDIPLGWGTDKNGKPCTNAHTVFKEGGLMPLGGTEQSSGYKGYGLSMMVEIFCGICGGGNFGPNIRFWQGDPTEANLSQCFAAIDPKVFAPGFEDRLGELIDHCRGLEPADGERDVMVPGDPEKKHMAKCDALGGIPYHPNQIQYAKDLAAKLNISPMKTL